MPTFKAGAAKADITPPVGCVLIGFSQRRAKAVHDPLYVKALVLDDGKTRLALAVCDALTFGYDIVERARELIGKETHIPPQNVMLTCTHTHSGPLTTPSRRYDEEDMAYIEQLVRKIAGAVTVAWQNRRRAGLGFAQEPVQIGVNRREMTPDRGMILGRDWSKPVNPVVDVLRVDGTDERPIAVLFAHAAHPVVLGGKNQEITADFPGYAAAVLEKVLGPETVAMFGQGCCGNINAQWVGHSFGEARRLGNLLGAAALKAAESATNEPAPRLSAHARVIDLPLDVPAVAKAEKALRRETEAVEKARQSGDPRVVRNAEIYLGWARDYLAGAKARAPKTVPYEIQVFAIGRTAIVGLPGEVFVEIGLNIGKRAKAERTIVLTYANQDIGFAGYVPTAKAFEEGGYEPSGYKNCYRPFPLHPRCAKLIEKEALKLIGETVG
ncbi:MAG: neutral/alkaline non-lysosomal ceramidase N-terminal domain-containing protein [Kiritimatiellae bacterium]|nr:neutral/alkaline non-lysosomal ceramidase N-terminal domain-containing protein [Kiritimatiellia bacterium]